MLTLRVGNSQDIIAEYGNVETQMTFSELGGYIGRSKDCLWSLSDHTRKISGKHMQLESQYGEFYITDISTNGTRLNGLKLERNNPTKLKQGDVLELGLYKLLVANISKNGEHSDIKHIVQSENGYTDSNDLSFLEEVNIADDNQLGFGENTSHTISPSRDAFEHMRMNSEFSIEDFGQTQAQPKLADNVNEQYLTSASNEETSLEDLAHIVSINDADKDFDFSAINETQEPSSIQSQEVFNQPTSQPQPQPQIRSQPVTPHQPAFNHQQNLNHNAASNSGHSQHSQAGINAEATRQAQQTHNEKPLNKASAKNSDVFLNMLCQKLGLSYNVISQVDTTKIYSDVIDILSYSMDGMIRLMMERNSAKNKLDSDLTMFTSQVKNPFKMSMSAKQALETILFDTNGQVMPPRQAVGESIGEIVSHFKKVDDSTREVVEMMVDEFDPEKIEREVAEAGRVLPGTLASKCWTKHKTRYVQMLGTTKKQKQKNIKEYISEKYNQSNS